MSIVVPARDEAESVGVLSDEIETVLDATGLAWECLWIDDGSRDGTLERLRELAARRPEHGYVSFEQSCGQSAALAAGFRLARGEYIITLDADLQNDPRDIPRLLEVLQACETDVVNGVRERRQDTLVRRVSSRIANGFRNRLTGERVTDVGCSLRGMRAHCARELPDFRGMHRFLPTLLAMRGYSLTEIPVNHRPRQYGRTKYGVHNRLWVGIVDTFGVRWLKSRQARPRIREQSVNGPALCASPSPDRVSCGSGHHDGV